MLKVVYRFYSNDSSNKRTNYSIVIAQSYIDKRFSYSITKSTQESSEYLAIRRKKGEFESFQEAWDQALYELYISGYSDYINNIPMYSTFLTINFFTYKDAPKDSNVLLSYHGAKTSGLIRRKTLHKFFIYFFCEEKKLGRFVEVENISDIIKESKKIYENIDSK